MCRKDRAFIGFQNIVRTWIFVSHCAVWAQTVTPVYGLRHPFQLQVQPSWSRKQLRDSSENRCHAVLGSMSVVEHTTESVSVWNVALRATEDMFWNWLSLLLQPSPNCSCWHFLSCKRPISILKVCDMAVRFIKVMKRKCQSSRLFVIAGHWNPSWQFI